MNIDWIEIPGGEFTFGLSAAQAEELLIRLEQFKSKEDNRSFLRKRLYGEVPEKSNEMYEGGADFVGFRPVLDRWHRQYWPSVDVQRPKDSPRSFQWMTIVPHCSGNQSAFLIP